ncbi:hypothetical protein [Bartonella australis]|uniref:hypothetical protein n=1 Tax=Bartonella australis TaxID=388640 RepID=UPI000A056699
MCENWPYGLGIKSTALFSAVDRLQHITRKILPRLKNKKIVLCNRYVFSSLALSQLKGV